MIYILLGSEPYLVDKKLNELIANKKNAEISRINAQDKNFDINSIVEACTGIGLFSGESLVLVKDPYFLIKKKEMDYSILLDYCNMPVYECDLIFYTLDNKFDKRLKIFKDISKNAEVIILDKLDRYRFYDEARSMITSSLTKITNDAKEYLVNNSYNDLEMLRINLDVLSLYPDTIDVQVINSMCNLPIQDNFALINALTSKKASLALKYANDLLDNDQSVLMLIASIASQLRFLYMIDYYQRCGYTLKEMINVTGAKEFRIKKAQETLSIMKSENILNLQNKLADLDYRCKTNTDISEKLNLELLIVSLLG